MINKDKLPRYFIVGFDMGIKVDYDPKTEEVFGIDGFGRPASPSMALAEGVEVDYDEFKRTLIEAQAYNKVCSFLPR